MAYALGLFIPLCSAPSIDGADGKKRADCLSPPTAGEFPLVLRRDDAQGIAGYGVFFLVTFLYELVKNP